ncbi:hypothetical protein Taro_003254 [Colocasia esculenta]|uniref:Uncharacterized protein n=1 Tax=Colocasia esculenta TaxID=4460 RepID=A0A843TL43_COLES|nr:hypothetical protein [Colocasia esculenta]
MRCNGTSGALRARVYEASVSVTQLASGSTTPTLVTSPVACPRFFVSQAVSSGLVPFTSGYAPGCCTFLHFC